MKKSLFAIAAVTAFAGAAQAQSSVSVYGIMDAGYASVSKTTAAGGNTSGVQSGGLASPRLGIKGMEDLGGGTKANFVLEAELLTANGADNGIGAANTPTTYASNQFFNRASYVGLSNAKWGEFKAGLSNTATYDYQIQYDPLHAANLGGYLNTAKTVTASTAVTTKSNPSSRAQNAVAYFTPELYGVQARVIMGQNQQAADQLAAGNVNSAFVRDFGLQYNWRAASVALTNQNLSSTGGAPSNQTNGAYASYDFGIVKPYLIYTNGKTKTPGIATPMAYITKMAGVESPITPVITLAASYTATVNGNANTAAQSANTSATALMAKYALSKRTSLYALGAFSSNGGAGAYLVSDSKFTGAIAPTNQTGSAAGTYGNQTAYMIGMNHTF